MQETDEKNDNSITTMRVYKDDLSLLREDRVKLYFMKKSRKVCDNDPELFHELIMLLAGDIADEVRKS